MRIFPIALIVVGMLGVARHLGLIPVGMFHLIGPMLLIALGAALLFRRPRRLMPSINPSRGPERTQEL